MNEEKYIEKFWSNTRLNLLTGCLEWQPKSRSMGYGLVRTKWYHNERTHRVAYELTFGPIPEGMMVRHSCHNRLCCNPEHLLLGDHQNNSDDKLAAGRQAKGEGHGMAQLTEDDVRLIRRLYATGKHLQKELASAFGTTSSNIGLITRGKRWEHVT